MVKKQKVKTIDRILNCIPSEKTEKDWTIESSIEAGLLAAEPPIPTSKDLRESWWKIGNQGSTGSCVGWASGDSVIRWHLVRAGIITKNEPLSTRYIWMASKETDQYMERPTTFVEKAGTSLKSALDVARKYGVVKDIVLPFASGILYPGDDKTFYAIASQLRISSYFNLGLNLDDWRKWIASKGPILTRLDVDSTWDNAESTDGNLDVYQPETKRGGHAVALVGYTSNRFIIRNSWGTTWGKSGFGFASYEYSKAAFTEAYGAEV